MSRVLKRIQIAPTEGHHEQVPMQVFIAPPSADVVTGFVPEPAKRGDVGPDVDMVGGLAVLAPLAKRPRAPEEQGPTDALAEQLKALQLENEQLRAQKLGVMQEAAAQKERAERAEARAPPQMGGDAAGVDLVTRVITSSAGTHTKDPKMWTSAGDGTLPRASLAGSTAMVKMFLVSCTTMLSSASCPPEDAAQKSAEEMCKRHLTAGTASYAEPNLFPPIWTTSVVVLTNWRPWSHGLVSRADQVGTERDAVAGLRFPSLSSYMAPGRMSYTGSLLGGRIIEAFGGLVLNPLCLD